MLSPHISSAFAQERQDRYRREAADQRRASRRRRAEPAARRATAFRAWTADRRRHDAPCPAPSPAR